MVHRIVHPDRPWLPWISIFCSFGSWSSARRGLCRCRRRTWHFGLRNRRLQVRTLPGVLRKQRTYGDGPNCCAGNCAGNSRLSPAFSPRASKTSLLPVPLFSFLTLSSFSGRNGSAVPPTLLHRTDRKPGHRWTARFSAGPQFVGDITAKRSQEGQNWIMVGASPQGPDLESTRSARCSP